MQEKQLMYYEHLSSKVHLKYKTSFPMSAEIIKLEDLYYGKEYCYGIDDYIKNLCLTNPELNEKYCLLNNMGYGTKKHLIGLENHGNSIYHRKSFKPCCNLLFI